ncbi:MAG: dTDP-glucose 4,6-dehydratase [Planctomycetota bacterium]|nr:MAG: dTDP-glucose 4,6-dehydratase [Planctomycetota bacterium]
MSKILVTGGAGFIGSNFVRLLIEESEYEVVNFDALTYAGNLESLKDLDGHPRYRFVRGDITKAEEVEAAFAEHSPDFVVHMAAESHVDRSVLDATAFVVSNVVGTQVMLDIARRHEVERFLHVSTDEVYGSLGATGLFTEETPLQPNSPYSASKTASDCFVRAAYHTHGMPTLITRCSNNYGPYQFPEKLIPLMIQNSFEGKPLPVYGDGKNIRDWIHVKDHNEAVLAVLEKGRVGEVYNIGGNSERENIQVVKRILELTGRDESLIQYVSDRPGHDRRYAIDASKIASELGFSPKHNFEEGLEETVAWYRANQNWCERVRSGAYRDYYETQYGDRLGGD